MHSRLERMALDFLLTILPMLRKHAHGMPVYATKMMYQMNLSPWPQLVRFVSFEAVQVFAPILAPKLPRRFRQATWILAGRANMDNSGAWGWCAIVLDLPGTVRKSDCNCKHETTNRLPQWSCTHGWYWCIKIYLPSCVQHVRSHNELSTAFGCVSCCYKYDSSPHSLYHKV